MPEEIKGPEENEQTDDKDISSKEDIVVAPEKDPDQPIPMKKPEGMENWKPKTELGRKVLAGEIKNMSEVLDRYSTIMEEQVVDLLIPELETELLLVGQSKGKFGGGQRRVFRQTQKKTMEGNKPKFSTYAVSGNKNGLVGLGYGKAKETIPAREKAIKNSKLNIIKIRRGCGSWQCGCKTPHSIPFEVTAKCGSVIVKLMPAPKGKGLCVQKECKKVLALAGIKDVYSKTYGNTKSRVNLMLACFDALKELMAVKVQPRDIEQQGVAEGEIGQSEEPKNDQ